MKILIFDVETTPILGYTWKTWKSAVGNRSLLESVADLLWPA